MTAPPKPSSTWRALVALLAAVWMVPVSCTAFVWPMAQWLSWRGERDASRGEAPHRVFFVALQPGSGGAPFDLVELREVSQALAGDPTRALRLAPAEGRFEASDEPWATSSYRVLADDGVAQTVEVEHVNDDYTIVSQYRASGSQVTPLKSRIDDLRWAFMFSFGAAFALLVVARIVLGLLPKPGAAN